MEDFYRDVENKVLILRKDNEFYLSIVEYKVVFTILSNDQGILIMDSSLQKSCTYLDFIKCFESMSKYLFEREMINKIIIKKPAFLKDLFIKDNYSIENGFLIKYNVVKEKERG